MKKYFLLLSVIAIGCSPKPEEQAVLDFEQKINGVKTDLSMNIKSMAKSGTVTAADSSKVLQSSLDNKISYEIESKERSINNNLTFIDAWKKLDKSYAARYIKENEESKRIIEEIKKGPPYDNVGDLNDLHSKISAYQTHPDSVLLTKYDCTYTIKNPALNNVQQELSKVYYIDGNNVIQIAVLKK